jgi:hypothetical protein
MTYLGVEFRNAGCLARDPSKDVDLHGVRKGMGNGVGDDLENGVGAEVAEVVDIRLDHDAFDIPDGLLVAVSCTLASPNSICFQLEVAPG